MTLGYYDAQRLLYGLCGKVYYIDAPNSEPYYFDRMMSELELLKYYIKDIVTEEGMETLTGYRTFTEKLFPKLAADFKLKTDWDYKDMYLALLEDMARLLKVKRFQIYTVESLFDEIKRKIKLQEEQNPVL